MKKDSALPLHANRATLRTRIAIFTTLVLATQPVAAASAQAVDGSGIDLICPLLEAERQRTLEDLQLELELAENEYRSRRRVFDMVEKLWAVRSIERDIYLDYKRLRDRTRVRVGRVAAQIAQQQGIVEQYELACGQVRGESSADVAERIHTLQREYRRIDCDLLDKDVEIAKIDYEYDAAVLAATRTLVESNVETQFELVIDEHDLSQSKARVEGFRRRAKGCRGRSEP